MNRAVRKKVKAAKEGWVKEQCKNIEKGMMTGNSKEACNTLKALTKTRQHMSAVIEDSSGNTLMENTAVLNRWTEYCSGLYNYQLHQTLAYSRVTRPPHKMRKAYLRCGKRLKTLCRSLKEVSLQERTFPLSCLRMEAKQQQS